MFVNLTMSAIFTKSLKMLSFIVLWECKSKIFQNSREPQLITLAADELSISTLKNSEYTPVDQSRC
jgi:hypothetical protein